MLTNIDTEGMPATNSTYKKLAVQWSINKSNNSDKNLISVTTLLKGELLPCIDKKYPTELYRVFIGHSIAGLRVVHTAIYNSELFNSYIAIDPSLGDERNKWYSHARTDIEKFNLEKNRMYIEMGQTMPIKIPRDTSSIKKDIIDYSNHMRRIMEFPEKMMKKNTVMDKKFD